MSAKKIEKSIKGSGRESVPFIALRNNKGMGCSKKDKKKTQKGINSWMHGR